MGLFRYPLLTMSDRLELVGRRMFNRMQANMTWGGEPVETIGARYWAKNKSSFGADPDAQLNVGLHDMTAHHVWEKGWHPESIAAPMTHQGEIPGGFIESALARESEHLPPAKDINEHLAPYHPEGIGQLFYKAKRQHYLNTGERQTLQISDEDLNLYWQQSMNSARRLGPQIPPGIISLVDKIKVLDDGHPLSVELLRELQKKIAEVSVMYVPKSY